MVDNHEYFFGYSSGILTARGLASHAKLAGKPHVLDMGFTFCSGTQLALTLAPYFEKGSYDLLRKNCNSFSDCALYLLVGKRLDLKYSALERMASNCPSLVRLGSGGQYVPNPKAADFDVDTLIEKVLPSSDRILGNPIERSMSDISSLREFSRPRDSRFALVGEVTRNSGVTAEGPGTGEGAASETLHKAADAFRILADAFLASCRSPVSADESDYIYDDDDLAQRLRPYQEDPWELIDQRHLQLWEEVLTDDTAQRSRPITGRSISVGGG
jgi:hypothetical protein